MLQQIWISLRVKLNQWPTLKNILLKLMDFYFYFVQAIVGNIIRIPAYFKNILNSNVIAKPGLFSFGAILNPGALLLDDKIIILANGQKLPWFAAKGINKRFYMQGSPVLMELKPNSQKVISFDLVTQINDMPSGEDYAIEDFRLFAWKNNKMINHSLIHLKKNNGCVEQVGSSSALSVLNLKKKTISFCAIPNVDFSLQKFEKNWIYIESDDQLLLFYSVNPFKVLALQDEKSFSFKTIVEKQLSSKIYNPGGFGSLTSFSTNPIDFDGKYWLIVIHQIKQIITGRCYFHWAVLVSKNTLIPESITSKPIFTGMGARGKTPGIRYISSVLKIGNEILFFAGEGDMYVVATRKTVHELNKLFITLN